MGKSIIKNISLAAFGLLLFGTTTVSAQEVTYGPYDGTQNVVYWGNYRNEDFDVAIHIDGQGMNGVTVNSMVIPFAVDISMFQPKGAAFLTKNLTLDGSVNAPDVEVDSFDIKAGEVKIVFKQPYTITDEGVYVGYSFKLNKRSRHFLPLVTSAEPKEENLYLHSTRTYTRWGSQAASIGGEAAIQVNLGGIAEDIATLTTPSVINTQINQATPYYFILRNLGSTQIRSIDYDYSLAGNTYTVHKDFDTPVSNHINASDTVSFDLPALADAGTYQLTVNLNKVNGVDNASTSKTATTTVNAYSVLPVKRALLEEYTGTGCGFCPRGFVGMEHMNELLGDNFVGVSYHFEYTGSYDPMEFITTDDTPSDISSGLPASFLDRDISLDAYQGTNANYHFNIDEDYARRNQQFGVAVLSTQAYFTDAAKGTVEAKTSVEFPNDIDANKYQLAYILSADGLTEAGDPAHQSGWAQSNYYPTLGTNFTDDDMQEFVNGADHVSGLTYNFVVCGRSGKGGIEGSLPASIKANEPISYTYDFDLSKSVNTHGNAIIQDKSQLHVITLLIDTETGHVANALKSKVYDDAATGINGVYDTTNNVGNVSRQYFTIDGKRFAQPQKGLNIVRLSNGQTFKAIMK